MQEISSPHNPGATKQIEGVLARRDAELHGRLLKHAMDGFSRYGNDCIVLFDPTPVDRVQVASRLSFLSPGRRC